MRFVFMLLSINIRELSWYCMFLDERFTHKCSFIKRSLLKFATSFSVGVPRTLCAYFVSVLSVLYTVSVLILHRKASHLPPLHHAKCSAVKTLRMRQSQHFVHACQILDCWNFNSGARVQTEKWNIINPETLWAEEWLTSTQTALSATSGLSLVWICDYRVF